MEPLVLYIPQVASVCLVGYHRFSDDLNEVAALFVVLKHPDNHEQIADKIRETLAGHLSRDELLLIHDIHFRESFPLTTCGKMDRPALRKIAADTAKLHL